MDRASMLFGIGTEEFPALWPGASILFNKEPGYICFLTLLRARESIDKFPGKSARYQFKYVAYLFSGSS